MVVAFFVVAAVVLVLGVLDHVRPGRHARRSARTTPVWLDEHRRGSNASFGSDGGSLGGFGGGFGDGGGCSGGDGGGGGC